MKGDRHERVADGPPVVAPGADSTAVSAVQHPRRLMLSVGEAARELGVGTSTVRRLIHARKLDAVRFFPGGDFHIRPGDLQTFVDRLETERQAGLRLVHGRRRRS